MKKSMKKVLSAMLAATIVMSASVPAWAEPSQGPSEEVGVNEDIVFNFTKKYKTTGEIELGTIPVPSETLKFTVEKADTNPDNTLIEINDTSISGTPQDIQIIIPKTYTKVGKYDYTVTENPGNTQGVTYSDNSFGVQVLVTYGDGVDKEGNRILNKQVTFSKEDENGTSGAKVDSITNIYEVGSLEVNKTVTGNLGDKTKEFEVDITFSSEEGKYVQTPICIDLNGDGDTGDEKEEIAANWTGSKTVTAIVKHGSTVSIPNLPAGVTYTVKEHDYTKRNEGNTKENDENGYDDAKYSDTSVESADTSANGQEGSIAANDKDKVFIVNNKGTEVNTGISLDSMPYLMVLALAALGLFGFVSKKRYNEF